MGAEYKIMDEIDESNVRQDSEDEETSENREFVVESSGTQIEIVEGH